MKYLLAIALAACATPQDPYITEHSTTPVPRYWANGQGSGTKVVTLHNPTAYPAEIHLACDGDIFKGQSNQWFSVGPKSESRVLVQVPVHYLVGDACDVTDWVLEEVR